MKEDKKKPINIEIGKNIRKYRELCGYTREHLAEKAEITPRFVAQLEVGNVGISPTTLKKICNALAISSDRILWSTESRLNLDERAMHLGEEYLEFLHKSLLIQIEMIEKLSRSEVEADI